MKKIIILTELGVILLNNEYKILSKYKFSKYDGVEDYLKINSGRLDKNIKKIIRNYLTNGNEKIYVNNENLVKSLKNLGMHVQYNDEIINKLDKFKLLRDAKFISSIEDGKQRIQKFALQLSQNKLRTITSNRDLYIVQAIDALDEIDKLINIKKERIYEWYGLHFPELENIINNPINYSNIVCKIGDRTLITSEKLKLLKFDNNAIKNILSESHSSTGGKILKQDLTVLKMLAQELLIMHKTKDKLTKYVNLMMVKTAPNLSALAGSNIGARFIAQAGSLDKLAKLPSSGIQILGAEKALFRSMKTGSRPPKHGIIFQHKYVHSAPKRLRGKIARTFSSKIAIAVRVDCFKGKFDKDLITKLNDKVLQLLSKNNLKIT